MIFQNSYRTIVALKHYISRIQSVITTDPCGRGR